MNTKVTTGIALAEVYTFRVPFQQLFFVSLLLLHYDAAACSLLFTVVYRENGDRREAGRRDC